MATLLAIRLGLEQYIPNYPILMFLTGIIICAFVFDHGSGLVAAAQASIFSTFVAWYGGRLDTQWVGLVIGIPIMFAMAATVEALQEALHQLSLQKARISKQDAEKDVLLQEAAHRVRNDLTTLSSMIRLQKSRVNAECREMLETFEHRLTVLIRVHQRLDISRGKTSVDSAAFFRHLIDDLRMSQIDRDIMIETDLESHMLSHRDAVALGLIVNEAVTNAIKYAFGEDDPGTIEVTFHRSGEEAFLIIKDDGHNTGTIQGSGLGTKLMRSMATQVAGTMEVTIDGGTRVCVRFP